MVRQEEVKVFQSVDDVRDSIDQISNDSFFTYGWFKTLESFGMLPEPLYLTANREGSTVAIAPCFIDKINDFFSWGPNILPSLHRLLNVSQRLGLYRNNILLCYSPACCRTKILFDSNHKDKTILNMLSKKIDNICREQKVLFSAFLFVSEFDELLIKNLESLNYTKFPNIVTFYLDVNWITFEDYLNSLKPGMRKKIRREIKKCSDNGVTIKEELITENIAGKLSELEAIVSSKYNPTSNNKYPTLFFMTLQKYVKDKIRLFVARKNDEVIGFSLSLQHKDVLDVYMYGSDYEAQTNTFFTYFNLAYYNPIQLAINEKIKKIYFRYLNEKVRLNRGCKPEQTYSFIKCHDPILGPILNNLLKNKLYNNVKSRVLLDYFKNGS
jgi:predicted N-acyltransferase